MEVNRISTKYFGLSHISKFCIFYSTYCSHFSHSMNHHMTTILEFQRILWIALYENVTIKESNLNFHWEQFRSIGFNSRIMFINQRIIECNNMSRYTLNYSSLSLKMTQMTRGNYNLLTYSPVDLIIDFYRCGSNCSCASEESKIMTWSNSMNV